MHHAIQNLNIHIQIPLTESSTTNSGVKYTHLPHINHRCQILFPWTHQQLKCTQGKDIYFSIRSIELQLQFIELIILFLVVIMICDFQ